MAKKYLTLPEATAAGRLDDFAKQFEGAIPRTDKDGRFSRLAEAMIRKPEPEDRTSPKATDEG